MARPENGFQLLVNRLKAFGNADQIVEILYSPEMDTDLRADRFSEWADLEPENEFVGRCAARTLVAAGRHKEAHIYLQQWLLRDGAGAEPNALMSEVYLHLKEDNLAAACARKAHAAAKGDLNSSPGFVDISAYPKIRDFARLFRDKHGCRFHIEEGGQTLIHFHHWRTGGTTIRDSFRNLFDPNQIFIFGDYRDPFLKSRQELLDSPQEIRREIRFTSIHHALPAHYFFSDKFAYFTLLRDPIETAVSWYHWHVKNIELDPQWLDPDIKNGISIKEYAEKTLRTNNGNLLSRWLINLDAEPDLDNRHRGLPRAVWEMSDDELVAQAMQSLDKHFAFVGLTKCFDASLFILCLLLHSDRIPVYQWKGRSGNTGAATDNIEPEVSAMLLEANSADNDLYQKIQAQFNNRYGDALAWFNGEMAPFQMPGATQFETLNAGEF